MTKRILTTMLAVLMVFSALMLAACTNSTPANTGDQQTAENRSLHGNIPSLLAHGVTINVFP